MPARKVLTLHAPLGKALAYEIIGQIEVQLKERMDATHVWIATDNLPDLTLMAQVPEDELAEVSTPPRSGTRDRGRTPQPRGGTCARAASDRQRG